MISDGWAGVTTDRVGVTGTWTSRRPRGWLDGWLVQRTPETCGQAGDLVREGVLMLRNGVGDLVLLSNAALWTGVGDLVRLLSKVPRSGSGDMAPLLKETLCNGVGDLAPLLTVCKLGKLDAPTAACDSKAEAPSCAVAARTWPGGTRLCVGRTCATAMGVGSGVWDPT